MCGCLQVPDSAGPEPGSVLPVQLCDALAGGAAGRHQRGSDQHHRPDDGPDARADPPRLRRPRHLLRRAGDRKTV